MVACKWLSDSGGVLGSQARGLGSVSRSLHGQCVGLPRGENSSSAFVLKGVGPRYRLETEISSTSREPCLGVYLEVRVKAQCRSHITAFRWYAWRSALESLQGVKLSSTARGRGVSSPVELGLATLELPTSVLRGPCWTSKLGRPRSPQP